MHTNLGTTQAGTIRKWSKVLGSLIAIASLCFVFFHLWQTWPQLAGVHIQPIPATLAFLCICLNLTISANLWHSILTRLGATLQRSMAINIWFTSHIVRYLPGSVWHLLGRAYLAQQAGVAVQTTSVSMFLELIHTITMGILIAGVALFFWPIQPILHLWILLFLVAACIFYFYPHVCQRPLCWLLQRFKATITLPSLHRRDMLTTLPAYSLTWGTLGSGLYFLTYALHPLPLRTIPIITGIFAIAWVAGFISIITPSGLGVREGVLSYLLSFFVPLPVALLLAILFRVWMTVAELCCATFGFWRQKTHRKHGT